MEFPVTKSSKFDNQKMGLALINLLISEVKALEEPHIVFKTKNLSKSLSKNEDEESPSLNASEAHHESSTNNSSETPCLFSSFLLPAASLLFFSDQTIDDPSALVSTQQEANSFFGVSRNTLPMTVCTKHGNLGFFPLEFAKILSEYTCTIHHYPIFREVHRFKDCVLRFPPAHPSRRTSRTDFQDGGGLGHLNDCYRCSKNIHKSRDIYMYRDNPFCSRYCRYAAHLAFSLQERVGILDMENGSGSMDH